MGKPTTSLLAIGALCLVLLNFRKVGISREGAAELTNWHDVAKKDNETASERLVSPSNRVKDETKEKSDPDDDNARNRPNDSVWLIPEVPDVALSEQLSSRIVVNASIGQVSPLENCAVTAQVRIQTSSTGQWTLQALDDQGRDKTIGGDEFYVTYADQHLNQSRHVSLVAEVQDYKNGTYGLDFWTSPMNPRPTNLTGAGRLAVYFQYTCGIGVFYDPLKANWRGSGTSGRSFVIDDMPMPGYSEFQPPTDIDLSPYDKVISFGDSLMELLVKGRDTGYFRNKTFWKGNIWSPLNMETLSRTLNVLSDWHGEDLLNNHSRVALLMGSSVWDVIHDSTPQKNPNFDSNIKAVRELVAIVRERYPGVALFWKSPSALHIHRVGKKCKRGCKIGVRYMSASRTKQLYNLQKKAISECLDVYWMDLYQGYYLSADYTRSDDGRHYVDGFNEAMLSWLYKDG
jgi:hypothetical protein